jgi:HEAT repeat protein
MVVCLVAVGLGFLVVLTALLSLCLTSEESSPTPLVPNQSAAAPIKPRAVDEPVKNVRAAVKGANLVRQKAEALKQRPIVEPQPPSTDGPADQPDQKLAPAEAVAAKGTVVQPPAPLNAKLARLLKSLDAASKAERLAAMKELGNLGVAGKGAVSILLERLRWLDKDHVDQGEQATRTLAQIGRPAVAGLIEAVKDPEPLVRARALWALGMIGPDALEALAPVGGFLKNQDAGVRWMAAGVLTEMGASAGPAMPLLIKALRDPDPDVRLQAAVALAGIGLPLVGEILPLCKDKNMAIRRTAVMSLQLFHEMPVTLEALVEALYDPEDVVRTAACATLGRLGPDARGALPRLLHCLEEGDIERQMLAYTAITTIVSPQESKLVNTLTEINARQAWAWLVLRSPQEYKEIVKRLLPTLEDGNASRRLGAVLALGKLGADAKTAASALQKRLNDPNRCVLTAAVLALGRIDPSLKPPGKTPHMLLTEAWTQLKSTKKLDPDELVQFFILASTLACPEFLQGEESKLQEAAQAAMLWAGQSVDNLRFSPQVMAALVHGLNSTAEFPLGFTEPFSRLHFKFRALVQQARADPDMPPLAYALIHLGESVPTNSPLYPALGWDVWELLNNTAVLDWMIARDEELLAALTPPDWAQQLAWLPPEHRAPALQKMPGLKLQARSASSIWNEPQAPPWRQKDWPAGLHVIDQAWDQPVTGTRLYSPGAPQWSILWNLASDCAAQKPRDAAPLDPYWRLVQGKPTFNPLMKSGMIIVVVAQDLGKTGPGGVGLAGPGGGGIGTLTPPSPPWQPPARISEINKPTLSKEAAGAMKQKPAIPTSRSTASSSSGATKLPDYRAMLMEQLRRELQVLTALKDQSVMRQAQQLMRQWGQATQAELVFRLYDPDPLVRWVALNLIGQQRLPVARDVITLLDDPFVQVRDAAHQVLIRLARGSDLSPWPLDTDLQTKQAIQSWKAWLDLQAIDAALPADDAALAAPLRRAELLLPPKIEGP